MDKTTKLKEAFKFALAFALVYGIALSVNWLSPSWAGWSVVAIAATSGGGESLQKGMLRVWGTLLAGVVGISIISVGAQDRWTFMFLTAGWLFFASYKMLANKEKSYFWFVAAYVTLVITAAGPSSAGGFYIAVFRSIETIMGIVVYTLIAVFLWPRSNIGAIKNAVDALLDTQTQLFRELNKMFSGSNPVSRLKELSQLQVKQLGQFEQSLKAEGSENYYVKEQKPLWDQFEFLNTKLLRSLDRLYGGIEDLSEVYKQETRADIDHFFIEINQRFSEMTRLFSGKPAQYELEEISLTTKTLTRSDISHFDKAALAIIIAELNNIEIISRNMVNVAKSLADDSKADIKTIVREIKEPKKSGFIFPVLDIEYLKGSLYVSLVIVFGFVIWFFINPPGHSTWYIMGGVFALLFAGAQRVKTVKLIIPFMIAMILASLIYVFVLPGLTNFYQLGFLLFAMMFIVNYFLSGAATAIVTIVIIQLIAINNPQTYNASGLLNSFVFIPMLMIYLYLMSCIINSPRPEKAFLNLVGRFFKSAKYLVDQTADNKTMSAYQRYKTAFYLQDFQSLPQKINVWGKSIDNKLFPNTDYQQLDEMVNSMEILVVRMDTLMEAKELGRKNRLIELSTTISSWKHRLGMAFGNWNEIADGEVSSDPANMVLSWMNELEEKLKDIEADNEDKIDEAEAIQFYQLLGGYRGVTEATLSFVRLADKIDWKQWKEERFQ